MQFTITVLAAALASFASAAAITKRGAANLSLETSSDDGLIYGELIYAQSKSLLLMHLVVCGIRSLTLGFL